MQPASPPRAFPCPDQLARRGPPTWPPSRGAPHRRNHPHWVTPGHCPGATIHFYGQPGRTASIGPASARQGKGESAVPFGGGNYEIRVKGRLSDSVLAAFEGLTATVEPVETVLHGRVQDQSSLHGLLDRIQSLGLELVEIRRLPTSPNELADETE